jgi:hypothetical protein
MSFSSAIPQFHPTLFSPAINNRAIRAVRVCFVMAFLLPVMIRLFQVTGNTGFVVRYSLLPVIGSTTKAGGDDSKVVADKPKAVAAGTKSPDSVPDSRESVVDSPGPGKSRKQIGYFRVSISQV